MPLTKIDDRGLTTPVDLLDNEKIRFGTGNDLQIYHGGTNTVIQNSTGDLYFKNTNNFFVQVNDTEAAIYARPNGAVELYHNGTKKLETTSGGVLIPTGNMSSVPAGNGTASGVSLDTTGGDIFTGRLFIQGYQKHADSDFLTGINNNGSQVVLYDYSNSKHSQKWNKNGSTELNYSGSKRFETTSAGTKNTGVLDCTGSIVLTDQSGDNIGKLRLGNNNDLEIYHNGTHTYADNDTGIFHIRNNTGTYNGNGIQIQPLADENAIVANPNGAVTLYFDNSPKLATDSAGVTVTGNLAMSGELNMTNGGNYNRFIDCSLDDGEALFLRSTNGGDANHQNMAIFHRAGASELYHAAAKKFETYANGIKVQDLASGGAYVNVVTNAGSQGSLYGTANTLGLLDGQNHYLLKGVKDGTVELYEDNSKRFETTSYGARTTGYHTQSTTIGFQGDNADWTSSTPYMHNMSLKWNSGHFVNSTGVFTCPVAGKYLCSASVQAHRANNPSGSNGQYYNVIWQKNSSNYHVEMVGTLATDASSLNTSAVNGKHEQVTAVVIIDCAANDTIRAHSNHGYRHNSQNVCSVYLLG